MATWRTCAILVRSERPVGRIRRERMRVNLAEIEKAVGEIDLDQGFDLIYDLLLAHGLPKASVSRLKSGSYDKSEFENEVLWKRKVFYRHEPTIEDDALLALIDDSRTDERIERHKPRFLIIRNETHFVARDQLTGDTLDLDLADLPGRADFFLPWAGIEKTQVENANIADVKAAEKMAKLYDEIVRHNEIDGVTDTYNLNVFFSRLLFCFFAEDTGVFEPSQFTGRISSLTADSGEDVHEFLDRLFTVLDTEPGERGGLPEYLADYGYVNGSLFSRRIPSPEFTARARALVIDCGTLDWAQINPDIFGSMIQAVVHPGHRAGLGMHYTSVENIMKVIRPLFLDGLEEEFGRAVDSPRRLRKLLERIGRIKVFDPACGSGNFLVIAYKELRKLEHRILGRLADLEPHDARLFANSGIHLDSFYGIEIDSFAHEIAMLSLWLAKHQMNLEFEELFGVELDLIPLKEGGQIVQGNATQIDWESVCPKFDDSTVYVVGNPPYLGSSMQKPEQKADFVAYFGTERYPRNLDYISLWFFKGAEYIADGRAELAFVSTNSVSQGDHTGLMWPAILKHGVEISFVHQSFLWSNQARSKAGVTCVVIGLAQVDNRQRQIFNNGSRTQVPHIGPYLTATDDDTIVLKVRRSLSGLPPMVFGSKPTDGGHLNFTESERQALVESDPGAETFVRRYAGADDLLNGKVRYCLWIEDADANAASAIPGIAQRLERVRASRRDGSATAQAMAHKPYRFLQRAHRNGPSILIPLHSSERREYIPMGFLDGKTVISNAAGVIYDAEPWVFGLIQSRMHMVWVRAVAGRLKSDYRYSSSLVYNTFPTPNLTDADRSRLQDGAVGILAARERFSGNTLAELYDPEKMPYQLREAHSELDQIVDRIYRKKPFDSDEERLELLFSMYSEMTAQEETTGAQSG